jgi:uncharacterized repeat protein (TIGR01451 family)
MEPLEDRNLLSVSLGSPDLGKLAPAAGAAGPSTAIVHVADLTVGCVHRGTFMQGQVGASYTITVKNSGSAATVGTVKLSDFVPAGLTATAISGTGWTTDLATMTARRSDGLAAGAAYAPIIVTVSVAPNAPASVVNTVRVSGGGEWNVGNDWASDYTAITPAVPDLTVAGTHVGNFVQGQTGATYTITVTNSGYAATNGTVTLTDLLPAGLTATAISGSGWATNLNTLTATRSDTLAKGASYPPITITVNVANNAAASVVNTARVSGGGESDTSNDTAADLTAITQLADLTVACTHVGSFSQGQTGATYTITVTNNGYGPTSGAVTLTDLLPAGLTATAISGTGWTTNLSTLTATRTDALAKGASYSPITVTVDVAGNAPASVVNSVQVSGGGEVITSNDTATDTTTISQLADLIVACTHVGAFSQGQIGAVYTITVTNNGIGPTSGTVTLADILPIGLTATAISGNGWTTNLDTLTATRTDALATSASYPPITVTVNVANNAAASVVNTARVSGGGESNTANDTATDTTAITQLPDLTVACTHSGSFSQGQTGATYTITVTNSGYAATNGTVTLTDILPAGLTATAISGDGWTTDRNTLTATRTDALAAGTGYSPITVTVNVANDAQASVVNTVQVSGGGESNTSNDAATDTTIIDPTVQVPQLVGTDLSVRTARDGQTIIVKYQITSGAAASLSLGCNLVGPAGEIIQDVADASTITIAPGTAWYTRNFAIDLPPDGSIGAYDVTWTLHSTVNGDASVTQADFLTMQNPVSVKVPVLMYHNIATTPGDWLTTTTADFRADMLALKAYGYTAVTLKDVLDYRAGVKTAPAKPVLITLDDGYQSVLTQVLPIISDPAINFQVTSFIVPNWVRPESVPGGYPTDPLSWSEIRTLDASGRVNIESHTVDHTDLTTLTGAALAAELVTSKNTIEQQLNLNKQPSDPQSHVTAIAYPYGTVNDAVRTAVWQAGYTAALQVADVIEMTSADKFALDRLQMDQQTSVRLDESGWYEFLFNRVQDPDIKIPDISITALQYLDPTTRAALDITKIKPGQSILIHVDVNNAGMTSTVIASLALDSDTDHSSVVYDSHATGQDVQVTCPWGASTFEWTWTVPTSAALGQYYSLVTFHDPHYVAQFQSSQWQTAFRVISPSGSMSPSGAPGAAPSSSNDTPPVKGDAAVTDPLRKDPLMLSPAVTPGQTASQDTFARETARLWPAANEAIAHDLALADILRSWRVSV